MSDDHENQEPIQQGLLSDFLTFLKEEKIWWIAPLILVLLLLVAVAVLGKGSGVLAPFIYPFA